MTDQEESNVVAGRFGKHCIAPGCTNYYYKAKDRHYHQLPLNDKSILKQWLQNMKRKSGPVNAHARVCSDHFKPDDYEVEGCFDQGVFAFRKTCNLKPNAVLTVFNFKEYDLNCTDIPSTSLEAAKRAGDRNDRMAKRETKREQIKVIDSIILACCLAR